jgi:hypothetical protein
MIAVTDVKSAGATHGDEVSGSPKRDGHGVP